MHTPIYDSDAPYIELVISPNNPDGYLKEAVANMVGGKSVHDFSHYWPHYTPTDQDLMLFSVSTCTGHEGTRIGLALVKDPEVARRMTEFVELNTIGVSKESQLRVAKILRSVIRKLIMVNSLVVESDSLSLLVNTRALTLACQNIRQAFETSSRKQPLNVLEADCESFLRRHNIMARSGKRFGAGPEYARITGLVCLIGKKHLIF